MMPMPALGRPTQEAGMSKIRKRSVAVLTATVAITLLAACGDSGSSALSKDEFIKQGNDICTTGNQAIDSSASSAFPDSTAQPTPDQIKSFAKDILIPNIRKQLDGLDKLNPPKDLQSKVDKLLADARAALTKMEQLADSNPEALFDESQDPFAAVNAEARDIGLTVCGSDSSS
jgi:hypothetical protein